MKYLSLFSGIGGFELGIAQAVPNSQCIGYSEVNKYARWIYERHFPGHRDLGDATAISTRTLPEFDLLVGGFPCQSFSAIGNREGFQDARGTLFFEIVRILADKRPAHFLLENVKGLLGNKGGQTFQKILEILTNVGYILQWEVLNSRSFGVPQSRPRVFIVGTLRGRCGPQVFPIGEGCEPLPINSPAVYPIDAHYYKGPAISQRTMILQYGRRTAGKIRAYNDVIPTLAVGTGGHNVPYAIVFHENKGKNIGVHEEHTVALRSAASANYQTVTDGFGIRRLTPVECERLQGFPDHWTATGIKEGEEVNISDTQRYRRLGNAVTVPVIEHVIKRMYGKE